MNPQPATEQDRIDWEKYYRGMRTSWVEYLLYRNLYVPTNPNLTANYYKQVAKEELKENMRKVKVERVSNPGQLMLNGQKPEHYNLAVLSTFIEDQDKVITALEKSITELEQEEQANETKIKSLKDELENSDTTAFIASVLGFIVGAALFIPLGIWVF